MKVIVPANNKGGVGKTSLSTVLADYFSKVAKKKTLLVDLDPQCNLSQRALRMDIDPSNPEGHIPPLHPDYQETDDGWDGRSSIADIFLRAGEGVVPYPTMNENLDIMPAHAAHLLAVEQCRKEDVLENIYNRFAAFLSQPDVQAEYEYVVIDTAPSRGSLTRSAVRAATHLVIPTIMEDKPIKGVFGMLQLWVQESARRTADMPLDLIGILANMFDGRTTLHNDLYEALKNNKEIGQYVMPCKLAKRIVYAENDSENAAPKSLFDLPNSSKVKQEIMTVCDYVMERIKATEKQMETV